MFLPSRTLERAMRVDFVTPLGALALNQGAHQTPKRRHLTYVFARMYIFDGNMTIGATKLCASSCRHRNRLESFRSSDNCYGSNRLQRSVPAHSFPSPCEKTCYVAGGAQASGYGLRLLRGAALNKLSEGSLAHHRAAIRRLVDQQLYSCEGFLRTSPDRLGLHRQPAQRH